VCVVCLVGNSNTLLFSCAMCFQLVLFVDCGVWMDLVIDLFVVCCCCVFCLSYVLCGFWCCLCVVGSLVWGWASLAFYFGVVL